MVAVGDVDEQGHDLFVFRGGGEVDRLVHVVGGRVGSATGRVGGLIFILSLTSRGFLRIAGSGVRGRTAPGLRPAESVAHRSDIASAAGDAASRVSTTGMGLT